MNAPLSSKILRKFDLFYVYALCSSDGLIHYIGRTKGLERRFKAHLYAVGNSRKSAWIRATEEAGGTIVLRVLGAFQDSESARFEEWRLIVTLRPDANTSHLGKSY